MYVEIAVKDKSAGGVLAVNAISVTEGSIVDVIDAEANGVTGAGVGKGVYTLHPTKLDIKHTQRTFFEKSLDIFTIRSFYRPVSHSAMLTFIQSKRRRARSVYDPSALVSHALYVHPRN